MNSNINSNFAKCFVFFMAVVILLQGCVYLGLSIWGITLKNCSREAANITTNPFRFAVELIYFLNEDCGNTVIPTEVMPNSDAFNIDWSRSFIITNRMNIFLITYAIVSSFWIITSLLVLTTICGKVTKIIGAICIWPWFIIVMVGSVLDAVATGYHIYDIMHTTSTDETLNYIGLQVNDVDVLNSLRNFDVYFMTPAIVMTCISSRVALIWLLNIFGSCFCLSISRSLAKKNHLSNLPQSVPENIKVDKTLQLRSGYVQQQSITEPSSAQTHTRESHQHQTIAEPQLRLDKNYNRQISNANYYNATYRNSDIHPDRLDYPAAPLPAVTTVSPTELSALSPLNNRYSGIESVMQSQIQKPQQQQQQHHISDELRSQLPWSYTSMVTNSQNPRKPQVHVYPKISDPDYTN